MRVWSKKESRVERDRARHPWRIAETGVTAVDMDVEVMAAQAESMPSESR